MDFFKRGRFHGITFIREGEHAGKVYNGYSAEIMTFDDYQKWAIENGIYDE